YALPICRRAFGEAKRLAHYITTDCTGCTACVKVCPVQCITGDRRQLHVIDSSICIDCHACSYVCPEDAIEDQFGNRLSRIPGRSNWPRSEERRVGKVR